MDWRAARESFRSSFSGPRKEVVATTIVVLIASFVFSFYLWAADIVILRVYGGVLRIFSP